MRSFTVAAVMFSQPMVGPEDFGDADRSLLILEPPLPGKVAWIDQYTLGFFPDRPASGGLPVKVRVSPDIRSLSGARLDGPREYAFTLPGLAVDGVIHVDPDFTAGSAARPTVEVEFRPPVEPDAVSGKSFFVWGPEGAEERTPARWTRIPGRIGETGHRLRARPEEDIPADRKWTLLIAKGTTADAGLAPLAEDFIVAKGFTLQAFAMEPLLSGSDVGEPDELNGALLKPGTDHLAFRFSNPVRVADVAPFIETVPPHLRIEAPRGSREDRREGLDTGGNSKNEPVESWITLRGGFAPETKYAITFRKGMRDVYGHALAGDRVFRYRTGPSVPEKPRPGLESSGGILESALPAELAVRNGDRVEAGFFGKVIGIDETVRLLSGWDRMEDFWEEPRSTYFGREAEKSLKDAFQPGSEVYETRLSLVSDGPDRAVAMPLSLSELLRGREREGMVLVREQAGGRISFFQVTDLALTAKIGATGSLAWVTRLSDGKPAAGAAVKAFDCAGSELWSEETGEDGTARLPGAVVLAARMDSKCRSRPLYRPKLHFTADKGPERIFWSLEWYRDFHPDAVGTGNALVPLAPGWAEGFLIASQPTYGPGETVRLKAVARLLGADGISLPEARRVGAVVRDPGGRIAYDRAVEMSPYGTVSFDFAVPDFAEDGEWQVFLDLDPRKGRSSAALAGVPRDPDVVGPMAFSVRRKANLPFELSLGKMPDAFAGDRMSFSLKAAFPEGVPLDGGEAGFSLSWHVDWGYRPPGFGPEWSFTARETDAEAGLSADNAKPVFAGEGRSPIAPDGTASFEATIPDSGPPAPRAFVLAAKAADLGGQTAVRTGGFTAHPASLYAGLSASGRLAEAGAAFPLKVVAVGADGTAVPGAKIRISLFRRTWPGGRRLTPGGYDIGLKYIDRLVSEKIVEAGEGPVEIWLMPLEPGEHYVTAEVRDSSGGRALARLDLWASGARGAGDSKGAGGSAKAGEAGGSEEAGVAGGSEEAGEAGGAAEAGVAGGAAETGEAGGSKEGGEAGGSEEGGEAGGSEEGREAGGSEEGGEAGGSEVTGEAGGFEGAGNGGSAAGAGNDGSAGVAGEAGGAAGAGNDGSAAGAGNDGSAAAAGKAGEDVWCPMEADSVGIVTDADEYSPGDVAKVLVQSPFAEGTGLLTLERGGVYEARTFDLAGGAPVVEIPLSEEDAPSVYASVLVVRGRTAPPPADGEDSGGPAYRRGYFRLKVNSPRDRLAVEVTPSEAEAPTGSQVNVKVKVTDAEGRPFPDCEVALAIVRAGTVGAGGDGIFRPETFLRKDLPLRVQTASSLAELLAPGGLSRKAKGRDGRGRPRKGPESAVGDGGIKNPDAGEAIGHLPAVAFYPALELDGNGEAEAGFSLPEEACDLNVYAVAIGRGRSSGTGEARISVTKAFALRPALPETLTVGDEFLATVAVTGDSEAGGELAVRVSLGDGLELLEGPRKSLGLKVGETVQAGFRARAVSAGRREVVFEAELAGLADRSVSAIDVVPAGDVSAIAAVSLEQAGSSMPETGLPPGADPAWGGLDLAFAAEADGVMDAALKALEAYPHDGLDQSTARAAGALYRLILEPGLRNSDEGRYGELRGTVDAQLALIESRLRPGGLMPRPGGGKDSRSPVLTAWALDFVREARIERRDFPWRAMEKMADYLEEELAKVKDGKGLCSLCGSDSRKLYVIGALFRAGRRSLGEMGDLDPYYGKLYSLGINEKILLLRALAALPRSDARDGRIGTLVPMVASELDLSGRTPRVKEASAREDPDLWIFGADDLTAQAFLALSEAAPGHELLQALVMGAGSSLADGGFGSSNRLASALRGVVTLRKAAEAERRLPEGSPSAMAKASLQASPRNSMRVKAVQGHRTVLEGDVSSALRGSVPAGDLLTGPPPRRDMQGQGALWTLRSLYWTPREPDLSARGTPGLSIARSFRRVKPEPGSAGESAFRRGEIVEVSVTLMTAAARRNLVLEVPLPAGLVPVDFRLAGRRNPEPVTSREDWFNAPPAPRSEPRAWHNQAEIRPGVIRLYADSLEPGLYGYSYLARAAFPGAYLAAGPRAEEMYRPGTAARGEGKRITVQE
ncbi:MAG: hypothetical protein LBR80_11500 [Deltaproteobacteria bacterium]|nr:hypothetical protein [Deltaproteobacteria bacterium]